MASVIGFGGIFLRARDPKALYKWYEEHLGLRNEGGAHGFPSPAADPRVVFSLFKLEDEYFPKNQAAMINLQVDDLDGLLDGLAAKGVSVEAERQSYGFGKFGWLTDPEGNRIELWQPIEE